MAYTPVLGGAVNNTFPPQFPHSKIDKSSFAVTPIRHFAKDGSGTFVSHGTGFHWRHENNIFLVTARRVFSGTDPFNDEAVSKTGFLPDAIEFYPGVERADGSVTRLAMQTNLLSNGNRRWHEDPDFATLRTDIAALPVSIDEDAFGKAFCLNDDQFSHLMCHIGFDCSVLGYPNPNVGGFLTPIWRRGTFASEPHLPVDGKPMFLIDAATTMGFSGGPILRRHVGPAPIHSADGSVEVKIDHIVTTGFVGVYAGRLKHAHYGGEIPFGFYANRVPFVVANSP